MRWMLIISIVFVTARANCQTQNSGVCADQLVERLIPYQDQDVDYNVLYENILQRLANPVNVNTADADELAVLSILTFDQIRTLINYRDQNGPLLNVFELQTAGLDHETITTLLPFLSFDTPGLNVKGKLQGGNTYLMWRLSRPLELKNGFEQATSDSSRFRGSPVNEYFRFRSSKPGQYSVGLTAEKDVGEQTVWRPKERLYGFDYVSYHIQVQNQGILKNLVIGDFQNQFGQGLVAGGGFALGKGSETITTVRRSNLGSIPYTSLHETGFCRGFALMLRPQRRITVSTWASFQRVDASVKTDTANQNEVTSFQLSGLHRSYSELQKRKSVGDIQLGSVVEYQGKAYRIGGSFVKETYSAPVNKNPTPYNQYSFSGTTNELIGVFAEYRLSHVLTFGEYGARIGGGSGVVIGTIASLSQKFDLSLLYRRYTAKFFNPHNNAFSEGPNPQNEVGLYWGWRYQHSKQISLAGYIDMFKFPWLQYRQYAPSHGHQWLVRLTYSPEKTRRLYLQLREEVKDRNNSTSPYLYQTSTTCRRNFLIESDYAVTRVISMKTRVQGSSFRQQNGHTTGITLAHDVKLATGPFDFTARYALFDSDDYDNRQYLYEQDVWLAYSFPAYYGKGSRYMIMAQYSITKQITIWVRFSRTTFLQLPTEPNSIDAIDSLHRSELKFQIRISLS